MLTQAVGWDGFRLVATLQSLTPYSIPLIALVATIAVFAGRRSLALVTGCVGVATLLLSLPIVFPPGQPAPAAGGSDLRAASVNLLFSNERVNEVGDDLMTRDLDMVVFSEFTPEHADTLLRHPLADEFPHKINRDGLFAGGMAVWSRFPLAENARQATINRTVDATVDGPDGPIRVLAVHPPTPIHDFAGWRRDVGRIADSVDVAADPTLVIGDFNASYWHPVFRDVLDRGVVDAHMAAGRGWSTSWPTDEAVPPFVRLDHALTGNGLVSTGVDDFAIPGSDHEGFVVTITTTA